LQPALCNFELFDPYKDIGIDTQHQDHLGVALHLLNALEDALVADTGPTHGESVYAHISENLCAMSTCLHANFPSDGLKVNMTQSKVRHTPCIKH
jgi:hypothetical protein